jgi:hypothetical protein
MVEGLKGDSDQSYLCVDAEGILFRSDAPCVLPDDGGVDTQVCPDGRIIPADMICEPDTQVCPDGSVIPADSNCPVVNGGWCAWGAWSACSGGVQTAARSCDCPAPSSGGANCVGSSTMTQNCGGGGGGGCGSKCVEEQQVACTAEEVLIDNNGNEDLDPSKMVCTEDCTILQLDGTYACEMFCESNYIERVTAGGTSLEDFPGNNYFGDLGCYKVNPKNDNALLLCPDLENHIFINGNSEDVLAFYRSIMESTNAANEIMVAQCTDLGDGNVNCIINPDEAIGMYDGQTDNSGKSYFLRERTREDGDARVIDVCQAIDSNTIACFMVENVDVMGVQGQMSMDFGDNQAQLIETYCQQNCGDSQQYGLVDQDCLLQCSMSYANIQYDPAL